MYVSSVIFQILLQGFNSARSIVGITIYESAVTISNPNPVGVFMNQSLDTPFKKASGLWASA